jgi:hypothetical protein
MKVEKRVYEVIKIAIDYRFDVITYMDMRRKLSLDEIQIGLFLSRLLVSKI